MYSRKTGNIYSTEIQNKIDNFNRDVQEQYRRNMSKASIKQKETDKSRERSLSHSTPSVSSGITDLLQNDELLLIGLILLLLSEKEKDLVVIGVLAVLLLTNR